MKRGLAWALGLLIGLPALAIAAFIVLFDANALRPRLIAEVERATGRAFTVREIGLAVSLRPALELRGVTLGNVPGGSRPDMLRAERVAVQFALMPLLSRRVEVSRLEIAQPDLLLEIDAAGRGNWLFGRPVEAKPEAATGAARPPPAAATFHLEALILDGGRITWRSGPVATPETLAIARLEASAPQDGPAQASARGDFRGEAFTLTATTGPLMAFGGTAPWPIAARLGVAGLSAEIGLELAETPRALSLRLGAADLGAWWPGLRLTALDAQAATLEAPLRLRAEAALGQVPLRLEGQAATPGALLGGASGDLPLDLTISAGAALSAEVALRLRLAQRPAVTGRIAVARLDMDALPRLTAPPTAALPQAAPSPAAPASTRTIPSLPIPFTALRLADAALDLRIEALTRQGGTTRDIVGRLEIAEGKARLAPFSAITPFGPLALTMEADATATPPRLAFLARSPSIDAAALAVALGMAPLLSGTAQLDADLRGSGPETRGWAGSLAGHIGLALVDGALSRDALRGIPPGALDLLVPGGLPPGDIALRCFALRAPIEAGVLRLSPLFLDGALGSMSGSGTVDLGQEILALRLLADLRTGRLSVRAPINIVGPWRAPQVGVDPAAAAAAGIGALLSRQRLPDRTVQGLAEALGVGRGAPAGSDCDGGLAAARGTFR